MVGRFTMLGAVVGMFTVAASAGEPAGPPSLRGVWRIESADGADSQNASHPQVGQDLVFAGGRLFLASNDPEFDGAAAVFRVILKAGKPNAVIELVQREDRKEHKQTGVYAVDEGKLRLCIPSDRGGAVTGLDKGKSRILIVARRVKEWAAN